MIFLKNTWWGNRNWKFCGRSGLKVLCKHFGFQGHILEYFLCFPQYKPILQNMHKIFNVFSFNKLNTKWGQWQVKLWLKQLVLPLILGVKCTKVVLPFQPENSCYSIFFVTIFVFPAQPRPGQAASLQCDLSRETYGGLEPFSLLTALDKLFQHTLFVH